MASVKTATTTTVLQQQFNSKSQNDEDTTSINEIKNASKPKKWFEFETKIIWSKFVILITYQVLFAYYLITFPYRQHPVIVAWGLFYLYWSMIGLTAGIHRLWCHRTFKATLPMRVFLAIWFYAAGHHKITDLAHTHRLHHKFSDTDADPHNAGRGFFFSHLGWLVMEEKPEVTKSWHKISVDDLRADPVVHFFDKNYYVMQALFTFIIPTVVPVYFFGQDLKWSAIFAVFIRYPLIVHAFASINSFTHLYGHRAYDNSNLSTDNLIIGIATMGEGWHNYHHAFPWDYRAAEWTNLFFNSTVFWIEFFAKFGLIYDLKTATEENIKNAVYKRGDGGDLVYHTLKEIQRTFG